MNNEEYTRMARVFAPQPEVRSPEELEREFTERLRPLAEQAEAIRLSAFETEIRKGIAADIRAAAPKYLDNDVDVHVWHVLDDLARKVEHPDKDNA